MEAWSHFKTKKAKLNKYLFVLFIPSYVRNFRKGIVNTYNKIKQSLLNYLICLEYKYLHIRFMVILFEKKKHSEKLEYDKLFI